MSRRRGQFPKLEVRNGSYSFRYWRDVPGRKERQQAREVIGSVKKMTKSEAERKRLEFISKLKINSSEYRIPSSQTFADAVKYYREEFAPMMLRESTFSTADGHIRNHLEADWNDVPVEHINIDRINEWAWKKRRAGLSWCTIKNALRTMQRVLSCSAKDKRPPFSQEGLSIPERDKLTMKVKIRKAVSFSWADTLRIVDAVKKLDGLDDRRKECYAMAFMLAAASGVRCGELFALKLDDIDFTGSTIRVDESADQKTYKIGPCKNVAAYRTILLADREGQETMRMLKAYLDGPRGPKVRNPHGLVFHSRNGAPLRETNVLTDGLHPALRMAGLPRAGMHGFRHGCNRRWELAGMNAAILRQQMGHSSETMTRRYTGEIPIEQVRIALGFTGSGHNNCDHCDQNMDFGTVENVA